MRIAFAKLSPRMLPHMLSHAEQWQAVLDRDARWDGRLFYAVASTGVFCRPSCPSRRPNPENVSFFQTAADAGRAGFRACLRCQPKDIAAAADLVRRVTSYLERHVTDRLTLEQLGEAVGASPFHLQRTFRKSTGVSPKAYPDALRIRHFENQLKGTGNVTEAIYEAGFGASSRAYEHAGREMGMTPGERRRHGAGLSIRFTIAPTEFGHLLVASTERGVCAVRLGDSAESLAAEFGQDFSAATLVRDESLRDLVDQVLVLISSSAPHPQIPLDVRATAFQRRVWEYLQAIPRGETRSYSQVARDIGAPKAVRAVARACAVNEVALLVPCHRVVGADGTLTGYRWGLDRKRRLLEKERV